MARSLLAAVVIVSIALAAALTTRATAIPTAAPRSAPAASPASKVASPLRVLAQSAAVSPGEQFVMQLAVTPPAGTDPLQLEVSLYPCLTSRIVFAETVTGLPTTLPVQTVGPLSPQSLPVVPGGVELRLAVTAGGSTTTPSGAAGVLDLSGAECFPGESNGVYPLVVALVDSADGRTVAQLGTHLVYVHEITGPRLRFALVVPVARTAPLVEGLLPPSSSNSSSAPARTSAGGPSATVSAPLPPTGSDLAGIATITSAVLDNREVPVTLWTQAWVPAALGAAGAPSAAKDQALSLATIAALSNDEVLASPYVSVDPSALDAAGLGGDLRRQYSNGAAALHAAAVHAVPGTYVSTAALSAGGLKALQRRGVTHLLLGEHDVAGAPGNGLTETQTFDVAGSSPTALAAVADGGLLDDLRAAARVGPVQAADDVLADLALIDYELPSVSYVRGVVLALPDTWRPDAAFLDTLLSGLGDLPNIDPVTLTGFFHDAEIGDGADGNGWPTTRSLAGRAAGAPAETSAISADWNRLGALESAFGNGAHMRETADLLLGAESAEVTGRDRQADLARFSAATRSEEAGVSLSSDRTIRLTAQTAELPITIRNDTGSVVHVAISLSSEKLQVLTANPKPVTLEAGTTAVDVDVRARTAGVFRLVVTVFTPKGDVVLATGSFTVQSTSFSEVAIALSAGAILVLLIWWARTWRAGRREARSERPTSTGRRRGGTPAHRRQGRGRTPAAVGAGNEPPPDPDQP